MHQVVRSLHGKTGELTNEINNLHAAVGAQTGGGGSDSVTKQEVNTLISLQNQVHSVVKDIQ